jgi:hypothetical protein
LESFVTSTIRPETVPLPSSLSRRGAQLTATSSPPMAGYTSVEFISAERTTESYKLLPIGAAPTESYVLQAEPWSQNPHTLGHEFVSAVEILQNWLQQHRRDLGRRSSETHSVAD